MGIRHIPGDIWTLLNASAQSKGNGDYWMAEQRLMETAIRLVILALLASPGICIWYRRRRRKNAQTTSGLDDTPSVRDLFN